MLSAITLRRAYDLGYQAYIDGAYKCPWSRNGYRVTGKRGELAYEWAEGYDDAEREARIEARHARSCRYAGV